MNKYYVNLTFKSYCTILKILAGIKHRCTECHASSRFALLSLAPSTLPSVANLHNSVFFPVHIEILNDDVFYKKFDQNDAYKK